MDYFFNNYYVYSNYVPTDIYPIQYGEQQCKPRYDFGPCVRNNYVLHYVYSGKGIFIVDNEEYTVTTGQMFLIKPNQLTYYQADFDNPWLYRWIEFNGIMTEKLFSVFNSPVINGDKNIENALNDIIKSNDTQFELIMQKFWAFIASFTHTAGASPTSQSEEYVQKASYFIKNSIHQKITVNDIAHNIGINRSYLCRLFKEHIGMSPQQYILTIKLNAAAQYLKNTDMSIIEVSRSVGYYDYHVFNKAFKNHFGVSPSTYKKKNAVNNLS